MRSISSKKSEMNFSASFEAIGSSLVRLIAMPMIEGRLGADESGAAVRRAMGIAVTHQSPAVGGVKGKRVSRALASLSWL
jgi:hypothetical protein